MAKHVPELSLASEEKWRSWLKRNHDKACDGVWLVCWRKESGKPTLDYERTVCEALCFGWIDSLIRKLDAERYARKFTPRKPGSKWSAANKKRVAMLIACDRMAGPGLAVVEAAKRDGSWSRDATPPAISREMPTALREALKRSPAAGKNFAALPAREQLNYRLWINQARRPRTREKRVAEAVRLLRENRRLGLK